jgi:phosphopentomutase
MFNKRCILLVLDSVGIGELPDASFYGDEGSNTLGNLAKAVGGLNLPTLQSLGLGNIASIKGVNPAIMPAASFGKCMEVSVGKDTMTGHWEIAGIELKEPFPTYPKGFPDVIIKPFEQAINTKVIGNKAASGTEIINELGELHLKTGHPIVYTSADSVFQIAAHKEKISLEKLYDICLIARKMLTGKHQIARVIARPFVGRPGNFKRTPERKDFTVKPPVNILDNLGAAGIEVIGVGKIAEIFAGRGITDEIHGAGNTELMNITSSELGKLKKGLIFTNLVDFDMLFGHRNNCKGYAKALEDFDKQLELLLKLLKADDILVITVDHGCDPTTASTDHSREYIPLLITGPKIKPGVKLGIRKTFGDIGQTVAEYFGVEKVGIGESFLKEIATP